MLINLEVGVPVNGTIGFGIADAILDALVAKGVLERSDAISVLKAAADRLSQFTEKESAAEELRARIPKQ